MLRKEFITIQLNGLNLAAIVLVAVLLGSLGFAMGVVFQGLPAAATGEDAARAVQQPAIITGDNPEALKWFLEMDRVHPAVGAEPAVITGDDPEALKWFLEVDRVHPAVGAEPAVITDDDPEALKWFLEMDRITVVP